MGFFVNDKFNLVVSLRYTPSDGEVGFLCQMFEQVSRILHDATDGQHAIGNVMIAGNSLAGGNADIWIHPNSDVWPNSTGARLWLNQPMDISQNFTYWASILAHELSHYLYDLRDEYNNSSVCQGNITTQASIMEGYDWNLYTRWTNSGGSDYATFADFFADFIAGTATLQLGQPTEYCHDGNHNATANNNQNNINNNQSCWSWMLADANHGNIPYGLTAPGAGGPASAQPAPLPTPIVCTELIPEQRFMLVLDRSGSMAGVKIDQLKIGANFWVDYVNQGENLGIVTYSSSANLIMPTSEVPTGAAAITWRNARHTIVAGITASGTTAIGDGLRAGLNDIIAGGLAASQVMILFTDGLQNAGAETAEEVLPDIIAAGVKVYTIGLGTDQNAPLLSQIATTTGGQYFGIDGDIDAISSSTAITDALAEIAGESRENSGIISFEDIDGASVDEKHKPSSKSIPFLWPEKREDKPTNTLPKIDSFRFPVTVTRGSQNCTLGAMWQNSGNRFRVRVYDPNGNVVGAGSSVRLVRTGHRYSYYIIDNPMPGEWMVEILGAAIRTTKFRTIGFEVNNNIRLDVSAESSHVRAGEIIRLKAKLVYQYPLANAVILAQVRMPSGQWEQFKFHENTGIQGEKEEEKVYTLEIPTKKREFGQYLIYIKATKKQATDKYELDEYYSRKPGIKPDDKAFKVDIPRIYREKLLFVVADRGGKEKPEIVPGQNTKDVWIHPKQTDLLKRWKETHKRK